MAWTGQSLLDRLVTGDGRVIRWKLKSQLDYVRVSTSRL